VWDSITPLKAPVVPLEVYHHQHESTEATNKGIHLEKGTKANVSLPLRPFRPAKGSKALSETDSAKVKMEPCASLCALVMPIIPAGRHETGTWENACARTSRQLG
jgi:hypothetical protein